MGKVNATVTLCVTQVSSTVYVKRFMTGAGPLLPQQWACRNVKSVKKHCLIPDTLIKAFPSFSHWTIVQTVKERKKERARESMR